MKLTYVYPRALRGDGGVTAATWAWATELSSRDHDVTVACLDGQRPAPSGEVRLVRMRNERDLPPLDADVIMFSSGWQPSVIWLAEQALRRGQPYIAVPHGAYELAAWSRSRRRKRLFRPVEARYVAYAAAVHLYFERELRGLAVLTQRARPIVAPTGFVPVEASWVGGGGYLAWLGRYDVRHKGIDLLFRSLSSLPRAERPLLRMHGRPSHGDDVTTVQRLAESYGVGSSVAVGESIAGDEKWEFLSGADGYVHSSRWECHSIALLEALSLGAPCLIHDDINIAPLALAAGALDAAEVGSAAFGTAMRDLASRSDLGAAGAGFVREAFDWDVVIPRFIGGLASHV